MTGRTVARPTVVRAPSWDIVYESRSAAALRPNGRMPGSRGMQRPSRGGTLLSPDILGSLIDAVNAVDPHSIDLRRGPDKTGLRRPQPGPLYDATDERVIRVRGRVSPVRTFWRMPPSQQSIALFLRNQNRRALILEQQHDEPGRLRLAGVAPHRVHVVRTFVEGLAGRQRHFLATLDLHDD